MLQFAEALGRYSARAFDGVGYAASLLGESVYWTFDGARRGQPVRFGAVVLQMMQVGIQAVPIVTLLSLAIGGMLAIQSLYSLGLFGAESYAYVGIAFSVTREFAPLITGILVAGRSGSALAARLSTMTINQEVDALNVMGINPVRYLVAPALLAMVVMVPALTIWSGAVSMLAAGLYVSVSLDTTLVAFATDAAGVLAPADLLHGFGKSVLFAALIALIGVVNGSQVKGGAEGVGKVTTRAVVQSISAIVIADMVFAYFATV